MSNTLYIGDLPSSFRHNGHIAIDTETMGLNNFRDRLCVVQISNGDGNGYVIKFDNGNFEAPNLRKLLADSEVVKIMHYARFDMAIIRHSFEILMENIYCTKIASKLSRTYTDSHGLKNICNELLGVEISKKQQSSYWGAQQLTQDQVDYAASDVLHLHNLKAKFDKMLHRENRMELAQKLFDFLPTLVSLDVMNWDFAEIFHH